ncbi:hypothetical protein AMJ52_08640 [candidate division TA06 bacterium DG_78]|uniref:Uncharacterized protein n=1 Tax=candidate division TA06 bacterium DG_78 TaxID=1703772 RepID=A0A0S7Y9I3_UNCT6|nr:MAG: hypothetical protein AMJ52_08640 [candidate division TA06 bacterium DG_78]
MNNYFKLLSMCIISLAFLSVLEGAQSDSSFKSIHQLELEQHQKDTSQHDTIVKIITVPESTVTPETQVKAVINLSLLIVITIVLIVAIAIYFIVRSMSRSQRE